MGAKYALYENPNPRKDGKKQPLHARIVSKGTVRTEEIADDIADACGYSTAVTKGMLDALAHIVSRHLRRGYTVELNELGSFSISLKCRPVMDKKEIRSWSIKFGNVHFRGNKKLKQQLQSIDLERAEDAGPTSYTPEQRKNRALNYLENHDYINRPIYMQLNGCNHSTASHDLTTLTNEGKIKRLGQGKAVLYVLV
ncbi:HU family DNA-binding protein [uncultured Parabacteroides sp.]|jgi:predicted histone-like DNA-binding protein|uniref:HU family DNA-binding protein n=1 Tax=uncultured Parabacteroides sp. TaxID=512312 RepID=UPI0025E5613D|nr:HU family DNA-binding protein [uncultured Parabacteroides sp.]